MFGIDISMHNWGSPIDFNQVKNAGAEVVIIKCTEGVDYVDPQFERAYAAARAAGISHIGFYHFLSERDESDPEQQAIDCWNAICNKTYDVSLTLDIETNNYHRSASEITDRCLAFINKFKELSGQDVMIYTGGFFGRDLLDDRIKNVKAWIAHYGVSQPMWTGFTNVVGHQYAAEGPSPGYCPGVEGTCDVDHFTEGILIGSTYNGDLGSAPNGNYHPSLLDSARDYLGDRVVELQSDLIAKGYDCGGYGADGKFGQGTLESLLQFQRDNGLVADGLCGDKTWSALKGETHPSSNDWVARLQGECNAQGFSNQYVDGIPGKLTLDGAPLIREGAAGNITRLLQEKLISMGYSCGGAGADGDFGPATTNAVIAFQRDNGLDADGICGRMTWTKLLGL